MILIRIDDQTFCGEDEGIVVQLVFKKRQLYNLDDLEITSYNGAGMRQHNISPTENPNIRIILPTIANRITPAAQPHEVGLSVRHNLDDLLDFGKCLIIKEHIIPPTPTPRWAPDERNYNRIIQRDQPRHAIEFGIQLRPECLYDKSWFQVIEE